MKLTGSPREILSGLAMNHTNKNKIYVNKYGVS